MRAHRRTFQSHPETWRRDLRLLAASRGITMAGAEAGYIALMALAWHLTGSASQASLVLLGAVFSQTLGAPLAGWIGDRFDRKRVIVACEVAIGTGLFCMSQTTAVWQMVLIIVFTSFAGMTCGSALDAALPNLVPETELAKANATLGMVRTVGHMLGPVFGGILVATIGPRAAFFLDGSTSLVAGALTLCIGGAMSAPRVREVARTESASMLEGLRLMATDPVLRLLAAGWFGMNVCFAFVTTSELPLSVEFGMNERGLGMIISAWCIGSLCGAWFARRVEIERFGARVLVGNALACAVVFIGTGLVPAFWCVLAFMAMGGASMSLAGVVQTTMVQQHTEDAVRARVMAAQQGVNSAVWGANIALAGLFIEVTSPGAGYVYAGVWCIIGAVGFAALARHERFLLMRQRLRVLRPRHALESELVEGA